MSGQLESLSKSLAGLDAGDGAASEETGALVAGFAAKVEGLRAEFAEVSGKTSALNARIADAEAAMAKKVDAAEAHAKAAGDEASAAQEQARAAVDQAAVIGGLDLVAAALDIGAPFADVLDELAGISDDPAPKSLADAAATGVATIAALQESFPGAARAGLNAALAAEADDSVTGQVFSMFRAQFTGLPTGAVEGKGPDAVLGRARQALEAGDLQTAERSLIETALKQAGGNRRKAADRLGISERTLYRKIKLYGL